MYKSPKNPIFVQLSPIQCTYSNIFIRFFKFFPANTNIYQNSHRVIGVLCGLRQGVLSLRAENRGPRGILLYPWGKGVCKHKTGDCRLRQSVGQKRSIRRIARKGYLVIKPKTINAILSAFTNFRTWSTPLFINISLLKSNKRELIKISIQFVCKLQSIFFYIPKSTALYFHIIFSCIYIY